MVGRACVTAVCAGLILRACRQRCGEGKAVRWRHGRRAALRLRGNLGNDRVLSAYTVNATTGPAAHNGLRGRRHRGGPHLRPPSIPRTVSLHDEFVWRLGVVPSARRPARSPSLPPPRCTDGGGNPRAIAMDPWAGSPSSRTAQAACPPTRSTLTTGVLTPVGTPVAAGGIPTRSRRSVGTVRLRGDQVSNGVSPFSINATTGAADRARPTFVATQSRRWHRDRSFRASSMSLARGATSNVLGFNIGANGTLSPFCERSVRRATIRGDQLRCAGRFAYVANQTRRTVTVFQVAANVCSPRHLGHHPGQSDLDGRARSFGAVAYAVTRDPATS